jgi:bacterioferritin (cytochrome b1)
MKQTVPKETRGGARLPARVLSVDDHPAVREGGLIGEGQSTSEMAGHLHLSIHTIDTYRRRIRLEPSIRNAAELMHSATEWVLLEQKNQ